MVKKRSRANKAQFSIISALLVSVILVMSVISTYTMVRHSPLSDSPDVLTAIGEMNADIKRILDFTVGYYGSILQVTGNYSYAQNLTTSYLSSGLVNIARAHPEWNPSFSISSPKISTKWYMPESYSYGNLSVTYSLESLGIRDITFATSSALEVEMLEATSGYAQISVTRDDGEPELGLTKANFSFYNYTYEDSTWHLINPTNVLISASGVYTITLPSGIDPDSYSVQVKDSRGLLVSAFYSPGSVSSGLGIPHFTYTFEWDEGVSGIYSLTSMDNFVVEILQNGTIKWLGQDIILTTQTKPIPPIPVKALHVNMTTGSGNQEKPFQIEDWGSHYQVPLGLASNSSVFSNRNAIVFLVDHNVESVTLWWDGRDTTTQTSYAWDNIYFTDNVNNPKNAVLSTDYLTLNIQIDVNRHFKAIANDGFSRSTAEFLRINGESPVYWADPSYIIHHGIVRDIVQTEGEYGGDGIPGCPNVYAQIVLTFPANSNYYTYSARTIFVTDATRNLSDLSVLQLDIDPGTAGEGDLLTEDGIDGSGLPITSILEDTFYNATYWQHHWSQFTSGTRGAGVMFSDEANVELYAFDGSSTKTGALVVEKQEWDYSDGYIEINPVELNAVSFDYPQDLVWYGAVVTFDGDPIYDGGDESGLWVMVGYPPVITVDALGTGSGVNYVDTNLSDVDSSADKGSHSAFLAQKSGPDSVYDTLTEEDTVGSGGVTLIDAESFEGTWLPTGWSKDPSYNEWAAENNESYDGSYSADFDGFGNGVSGSLVTPELDCSDATSISVTFWYYDDNLDPNEFVLEYYDGSSWVEIDDIGVYSESTWNLYEHEISDSRYFVSDFKVRWHAIDVEGGSSDEHAYVDLVTVTKYTSQPPNYELDLEVRWTTLDFDETNEELCIYVGEVGAENLAVEVWHESAWVNVFSSLEVGWNNATISSYLTSPTLTIRFIAQTETGDTTPDYWTIDATLIRCWS